MNNILNQFSTCVPKYFYKYIVPTGILFAYMLFLSMQSASVKVRWCTGTAIESTGSKDATPAVINVGDHDGVWSPSRGRPGGRYGSGGGSGRLADVFLQPPNPLGPTSARLRWDVSRLGAKKHNIDGFHIKYRPVLDAERGKLLSISLWSGSQNFKSRPRDPFPTPLT